MSIRKLKNRLVEVVKKLSEFLEQFLKEYHKKWKRDDGFKMEWDTGQLSEFTKSSNSIINEYKTSVVHGPSERDYLDAR